MNIHKSIMELSSKAKMQQTVASALKILDEYEFQSANITEAIELLKKEAEKLDGEIEDLMDIAAGGKLDLEKAFEEDPTFRAHTDHASEKAIIPEETWMRTHICWLTFATLRKKSRWMTWKRSRKISWSTQMSIASAVSTDAQKKSCSIAHYGK